MLKAPVLFVVENNFFSSHMHIRLRQPLNATARFAVAHDIPFEIVDGNDVVAMSKAAEKMISRARSGGGPGFLEAVTFRWYGHVDWREDIDVGVNRSTDDLLSWRGRDPISRLSVALEQKGLWSAKEQASVVSDLNSQIAVAWDQAMNDPWPQAHALLDHVYAPRATR